MTTVRFKTRVRVLALVTLLATGLAYSLEQQAQRDYLALFEACNATYDALPIGQPEPADWRARCDLNTPGSDIVRALQALDRTQLGLFAAVALCLAVLAVPIAIYLRRRPGGTSTQG